MDSTSSSEDKFTRLIERVRAGCQDAAKEVMDTFGRHVIRTIRRHLNGRMRNQYDSIDFSQAVWGSFFRNAKQTPEFTHAGQLISYLTKIAKNKTIDECRRRLNSQRYNIKRESQCDDADINNDQRFRGKTPTPSAIVVAKETHEAIVENQPSHCRTIVDMKVDGANVAEIADETSLDERSVRRVLKRLKSRTEQ